MKLYCLGMQAAPLPVLNHIATPILKDLQKRTSLANCMYMHLHITKHNYKLASCVNVHYMHLYIYNNN